MTLPSMILVKVYYARNMIKKTGSFWSKRAGIGICTSGGDKLPHQSNPSKVPPASKLSFKPSINDIQSNTCPQDPSTQTEDVGVIVLPAHSCGKSFMAKGSTDLSIPVSSYRHTYTSPADEDTAYRPALYKFFANLISNIRVINRFFGMAPHIVNFMPSTDKKPFNFFFQYKTTVIAPQRNVHISPQ